MNADREDMIQKLLDDKSCRLFYDNPRSSRFTGDENFINRCIARYEARLRRIDFDRLEYEYNKNNG